MSHSELIVFAGYDDDNPSLSFKSNNDAEIGTAKRKALGEMDANLSTVVKSFHSGISFKSEVMVCGDDLSGQTHALYLFPQSFSFVV
jgi:hypothetical protein